MDVEWWWLCWVAGGNLMRVELSWVEAGKYVVGWEDGLRKGQGKYDERREVGEI